MSSPEPVYFDLSRVADPKSVAIVGVSEASMWAVVVERLLKSDAELFFVHQKHAKLFGRKACPDIASIGHPVDAVFTATSAKQTVSVVEQAAEAGCGGVVVIAGGFSEMGAAGAEMQGRVRDAAIGARMPVIGPNGVGLLNVRRGIEMSILPPFEGRVGGASVVAHSGAVLGAMIAAGNRVGGVGYNLLISAGNEAATDIADYLNYLVDDPSTRVIALAIETIRRPAAFFAAARRAREAGKPIVAIKLGRSARGQRIAQSHTGSLTSDGWTYEVALRQANIQVVRDVDELADTIQFLEQLPPAKWSAVRGLSVLTMTGGFASMASDIGADEGVVIPEPEGLEKWISETVPGINVCNPLDATGFTATQPELWKSIVDKYESVPELDTYLFLNPFAAYDDYSRVLAVPLIEAARSSAKPFILSTLAGPAAPWVSAYLEDGVALGNGLRGSFRGIQGMSRFVTSRADFHVEDPEATSEIPRPDETPIKVSEGSMLPFAVAMRLLNEAGVPIAPFHCVAPGDSVTVPAFPGPYVVKLADVAHRSEHGAVKLGVGTDELSDAIEALRAIAAEVGLAAEVVIQPQVEALAEVFVGIRGATELGPVVAFGLGGVFVESLKRVGGRLAPFSADVAKDLLGEFDDLGIMDGFRGKPAWDRNELSNLLAAIGRFAAGSRSWLATMDINPVILTPKGFVAVDCLCLLRD